MGFFGKPNFKRMAAEHDIESLYDFLKHRDKLIRIEAAQTLAEMNDGTGWRFLIDAARQPGDVDLQLIAISVLGELGHPRAVAVLAEVLYNAKFQPSNKELASAAREALELIGGPQVEEALQHAGYRTKEEENRDQSDDFEAEFVRPIIPRTDIIQLKSAEEHLNAAVQLREAEHADRGLVEAGLALWISPRWSYAWYVRGVLLEDLDRAYEAVLAYQNALQIDPLQQDAKDALEDLDQETNPPSLDPSLLLTNLSDHDWRTRRDAAAGLGELAQSNQITPDLALDSLIALLEDEEREVRHAAIEALGSVDDRRAVLPLLALRESSWLLRYSIVQCLARIGSLNGLVTVLHREMNLVQTRNPVFSSHKDPLLEHEYELLMEIGVRAMEFTGDTEGLLLLTEGNAWEEIAEEDDHSLETGYFSNNSLDQLTDDQIQAEDEEGEADEDLESYVDEVAQMAAAALERLAQAQIADLSEEVLLRLSKVPDLTLCNLEGQENELLENELLVVYDLSSLRQAAHKELARRQ